MARGRVFFDGTLTRPQLDHSAEMATTDGFVLGIAFGPDGLLYLGFYEPSRVARADLATGVVETVLDDPTAHLLCHPTNLAFRGTELFTSNLGRWHVTLIDALADPVT